MATIKLFYSYSHVDEELRNELEKHLAMLRREKILRGWHFRKITPGKEWKNEIDRNLETAKVISLLVSPDFMNSDYCYDIEMKRAMELHNTGKARVIPIILRAVDYSRAPFAKLQALPKDGEPVTSWQNRDEAFYDIAQGIRRVCEEIQEATDTSIESSSRDSPLSTRAQNDLDSSVFCSRCGVKPGESSECVGVYSSHGFKSYTGNVCCSRCGVKPGERSECVGMHSSRGFKSYTGNVYCSRCGVKPGESSECVGMYSSHGFKSYTGNVYCSRCGVKPGERSECVGMHSSHDFITHS